MSVLPVITLPPPGPSPESDMTLRLVLSLEMGTLMEINNRSSFFILLSSHAGFLDRQITQKFLISLPLLFPFWLALSKRVVDDRWLVVDERGTQNPKPASLVPARNGGLTRLFIKHHLAFHTTQCHSCSPSPSFPPSAPLIPQRPHHWLPGDRLHPDLHSPVRCRQATGRLTGRRGWQMQVWWWGGGKHASYRTRCIVSPRMSQQSW